MQTPDSKTHENTAGAARATAGNMKHVMVDLETLGTGPNACIVSIGAVRFDPNQNVIACAPGPDTFYRVVNLLRTSREELGDMDASTVLWWMRQEDDARAQLQLACESKDFENVLCNVLEEFQSWLEACGCTEKTKSEWRFWANDPDFDMVVLKSAFVRVFGEDQQLPWSFRGCRSMRTMRELATEFNLKAPEDHIVRGIAHHALDDAIYQAQVVTFIKQELRKRMGADPYSPKGIECTPRGGIKLYGKEGCEIAERTILNGGQQAMIDFVTKNRAKVEAALARVEPRKQSPRIEPGSFDRKILGRFPADEQTPLQPGDYVQFNEANGSYGKIMSISGEVGFLTASVEYVYGRDNRGDIVRALDRVSLSKLRRVSRDVYDQVKNSKFNTGFRPVEKALDIKIQIDKKPEPIKVNDYVRHKDGRVGMVSMWFFDDLRGTQLFIQWAGEKGNDLSSFPPSALTKITELDYLAAQANEEVSRAVRIIRYKSPISVDHIFEMAEDQEAKTGVRPTIIVFGDGSALNIPATRDEIPTVAEEPFDRR